MNNRDPVSVIDLTTEGPHFLKNLPGFGPWPWPPTQRAWSLISISSAWTSRCRRPRQGSQPQWPRYHIMTIDPATLVYDLSPVGNVLPRFAMAKSGKAMLCGRHRAAAPRAGQRPSLARFGSRFRALMPACSAASNRSFARLPSDDARTYAPFQRSAASLIRFVQTGDATRVFTLKTWPTAWRRSISDRSRREDRDLAGNASATWPARGMERRPATTPASTRAEGAGGRGDQLVPARDVLLLAGWSGLFRVDRVPGREALSERADLPRLPRLLNPAGPDASTELLYDATEQILGDDANPFLALVPALRQAWSVRVMLLVAAPMWLSVGCRTPGGQDSTRRSRRSP